MNSWIIITILFTHFVADFVLQTDYQAKNKSRSNKVLARHVYWYTIATLFGWWFMWQTGLESGLIFASITFGTHFVIDYFTSRVNKNLLAKQKHHAFFVNVGFDQFLHLTQLFLTYQLIF